MIRSQFLKLLLFLFTLSFEYIFAEDVYVYYNFDDDSCLNILKKGTSYKTISDIKDLGVDQKRDLVIPALTYMLKNALHDHMNIKVKSLHDAHLRFLHGSELKTEPTIKRVLTATTKNVDMINLFPGNNWGRILSQTKLNHTVTFTFLKFIEAEMISSLSDEAVEDVEKNLKNFPCIKEFLVDKSTQDFSNFCYKPDGSMKPGDSCTMLDSTIKETKRLYVHHSAIPNDPLFFQQTAHKSMRVQEAWKMYGLSTTYSPIVGLLDTGCNIGHPDMNGSFYRNVHEICDNGIDDDKNGYIDDCYGFNFIDHNNNLTDDYRHGVISAGLIGAQTNNGIGIAGYSSSKMFCTKIGSKYILISAFIEALNYLLSMNIRLINYAGSGGFNKLENAALDKALEHDILFVTPGGNNKCIPPEPSPCSRPKYPAGRNLDAVISAGALDEFGNIAEYSNIGHNFTDVFAQGNVFSTSTLSEQYGRNTGTSFAAPAVTGLAAYIWSRYPQLTPRQLANIIRRSSVLTPNLANATRYGKIDFVAALELATKFNALDLMKFDGFYI